MFDVCDLTPVYSFIIKAQDYRNMPLIKESEYLNKYKYRYISDEYSMIFIRVNSDLKLTDLIDGHPDYTIMEEDAYNVNYIGKAKPVFNLEQKKILANNI